MQLALEGVPYHKPGHMVGTDTVGLDLGPSSIAIVPALPSCPNTGKPDWKS